MKQQHRGAVQDPIEDYLDTNRPNEKAAPVHPTKDSTRTAEEQILSFSNEKPTNGQESVMTDYTDHTPVYSTWPDAIDREIIAPLEASEAVQDAWGEFDVEAIADRVLAFDDHLRGFIVTVSTEQFWNVVKDHARRPAHVPPRFRPIWEPQDGPEVPCWVADDVDTEALTASAVIVPAHGTEVRYQVDLSIQDGTAVEVRDAIMELLNWWFSQETHLDGAEVAS